MVEDTIHIAMFHDLALIHHHDVIRHFRDHAKIMRNEEDGKAYLLLQFQQQMNDLSLDGHIERGRRLIGNQQFRATAQGDCDHHTLGHASRQFVRVHVHDALGIR